SDSGSSEQADKRERAYAQAALNNAADRLAATTRGNRNTELNAAAFSMGKLIGARWIGRSTVEGRLHDAAIACGYVADDGEAAVRSTIKSGIEAGLKEPHEDLKERDRPKSNGAAASADQNIIDALARLGGLAYQKRRLQEAKILGIPVAALDKLVRQAQARAEDSSAELPHWKVEPW